MNLKVRVTTHVISLVVTLAAGLGHARAEEWGGLKGRFVFDGPIPKPKALAAPAAIGKLSAEDLIVDPNGGIANVMVFVNGDVAVHPDYVKSPSDTLVLEMRGYRFEPHVLGLRVGQTLRLANADDVAHYPAIIGRKLDVSQLLASGKSIDIRIDESEPAPPMVSCNIHAWMSARLLVRPNPYFAISNKDGAFEIKKLPPGDLEFLVYHERTQYIREAGINGKKVEWPRGRMKVTVKAGEGATDLGAIKLPARLFQ